MSWMPCVNTTAQCRTEPPENLYPIRSTWSTGYRQSVKHRGARRSANSERRAHAGSVDVVERSVALLLQQSRVAAHMSQSELGDAANIPVSTVKSIERGDLRFPRKKILETLGGVLGVSLDI